MIAAGQVYKSKRSNKEYYRVVDIQDNIVTTALFDFNTPKYEPDSGAHMKEKRVEVFLPHFEEAFVRREEEELAMKLLNKVL